jgi:protein-tyrosine phosphatase
MQELGITHIVNVSAIELENAFEKHPTYCPKYLDVYIHDLADENITVHLQDTIEYIRRAIGDNGKVLVHCRLGVSRSASVIIAYLMQYCDMSLRTAFFHVFARRPIVFPNFGFWDQLVRYECELQGTERAPTLCLTDYVLHMTNTIKLEDHSKDSERTENMRNVVKQVFEKHVNLRLFTYEVHNVLKFNRVE